MRSKRSLCGGVSLSLASLLALSTAPGCAKLQELTGGDDKAEEGEAKADGGEAKSADDGKTEAADGGGEKADDGGTEVVKAV
nr:hypothetical protein [Deltaproteobacteria bacterium]